MEGNGKERIAWDCEEYFYYRRYSSRNKFNYVFDLLVLSRLHWIRNGWIWRGSTFLLRPIFSGTISYF